MKEDKFLFQQTAFDDSGYFEGGVDADEIDLPEGAMDDFASVFGIDGFGDNDQVGLILKSIIGPIVDLTGCQVAGESVNEEDAGESRDGCMFHRHDLITGTREGLSVKSVKANC